MLLFITAASLYAGIIYEGVEYTETNMPYNYTGTTETFVVVSGTIDSYSSDKMSVFEINGVSMTGNASLPSPKNGKQYFIHLIGNNKNASASINGTNDWSTETAIDTLDIALPYVKYGADIVMFYTTWEISAIVSQDMDSLSINGVDFTNLSTSSIAPSENGYYIYYEASLSSAFMNLEAAEEPPVPSVDTTYVNVPFTQSGTGEFMFGISDEVAAVSSVNTDSLAINSIEYTNQTVTQLPARINGFYYIYYKALNENASMEITAPSEPDPEIPELISYNGNDYTVEIMPYSQTGNSEYFIVVSGTVSSYNSNRLDIFEINSVDMNGATELPGPVDGKKYFIHFKGKTGNAFFNINGDNDWIAEDPRIDTLQIGLPFTKSGADTVFFTTTQEITALESSDLDSLAINGTEYTNMSVVDIPVPPDGRYYIYYEARLETASMNLSAAPLDTVNINLPFSKTGSDELYFVTAEEIGEISSSDMYALEINGIDYKNSISNDMPEKINGNYYIYYYAISSNATMNLKKAPENPEIVNWNGNDYTFIEMPWSYKGGTVTRVYTYGEITSFSTNNKISALEINGQSFGVNQTHTEAPPSINQKYYITITPQNPNGSFEINGVTKTIIHKLNIKVFLEGAL